ncbi:uncharacterized protein LAJ45_07982 [Morchella importuna]|uniref:uncharacterized protein n=1 Tax=Morchella importuna TaxID=1174673 RepID=UPI001E8DA6CB|nr:uncharacterized protein LAJ45_07982 [Morchella importuna]KAH8147881.1 hypothetical protein LAJ45_07982 [Morchella importuna]
MVGQGAALRLPLTQNGPSDQPHVRLEVLAKTAIEIPALFQQPSWQKLRFQISTRRRGRSSSRDRRKNRKGVACRLLE